MNFVSWAFVGLFAVVFLARLTVGRRKTERPLTAIVLVASTIFVMWHVPAYLLIMLVSIGTDYVAAIYLDRLPDESRARRWILAGSLTINLGLLGFFKYVNLAAPGLVSLLGLFGSRTPIPALDFVLPMGISFYTFCSMSYTIDVYRRQIRPVKRFVDFYYFVTFFPHLVAGPIIRASEFFYQLPRPRRLRLRVFNHGVWLIVCGAFLKMVCADNVGGVVDAHWKKAYQPGASSLSALLLAVLFATQIFCDFAAYTSIARGLAYLMGFRFPLNFNSPYIAASFRNFWERWHMTLSRWLRDYLYIPLGGNRRSPQRTYANLLAVMLLGGLWHGAALTFIVWGAVHGVALAVERLLGLHDTRQRPAAVRIAWFVVVQVVVLVAWVFFRSGSVPNAAAFVRNMFSLNFSAPVPGLLVAALFVLPVAAMHAYRFLVERGAVRPLPLGARAALAAALVYATLVLYAPSSKFIYFQF